ncbi:hypothetical protein ABW19_dt0205913 [Dactylella cylindrospora]|nr:hypothetical protein ABW19_dt0205913 [Dactylella cylindrospora]
MSASLVNAILRRSDDSESNSTIVHLLTALVVLSSIGLILGGILLVLRRIKKKRSTPTLPTHTRNHSLAITTIPFTSNKRASWFGSEKKSGSQPGTPTSPVPEIRITFPEEESADGKKRTSRVVVVQVGEAGAAFVRDIEPDNLPPYQKKGDFASVDLDKVGGLKEKDNWS